MLKKKRKILFIILFSLFLLSITCLSYATARWYSYHVNDVWAVDSGKHMDWSGTTAYMSNWNTGVNTWNNYKSDVIRADTLLTVNDLTIKDVAEIASGVVARTYKQESVSSGHSIMEIRFATSQMSLLSETQRNITCTHEIGHALGLDENNDSGTDVIMYNDINTNTSNNVLHSEDRFNYDYMYNNKY